MKSVKIDGLLKRVKEDKDVKAEATSLVDSLLSAISGFIANTFDHDSEAFWLFGNIRTKDKDADPLTMTLASFSHEYGDDILIEVDVREALDAIVESDDTVYTHVEIDQLRRMAADLHSYSEKIDLHADRLLAECTLEEE